MTEQETITRLKTLTPEQLLLEANNGFEIRDIDRDLVRELRESEFSDGVINVLLNYTLSKNRGLRFNEVREIASSWLELEVKTMEEALELIIEEDMLLQRKFEEEVNANAYRILKDFKKL